MTDAYRTAGTMAPAAATRARHIAGAGLGHVAGAASGNACMWPASALTSMVPSAATKPATQKFVDVLDHRRRRLSEPSP